MNAQRPDPDDLLYQVAIEEAKTRRGRLKVFFGSNAGVGKTYAMLDEARKRATEGVDVLIGYAEQHIRPETEALLLGLEILPYKLVEHKGNTLKEFDLDAALARHPSICCVDELAHTNAPGQRHPKRWQDVFELLDAGINVYTTLNVQHLESVNDIVERISGIRVRETLPDRVLEEADEVELVDIAPDKLIERLQEGRIYKPQQVEQALKHFFNRGNLIALRELALRKTAERVDAQMLEARRAAGGTIPTWAASERILVCVGPSPFAPQLVRAAKRLAAAFRAPWQAVSVETTATEHLTEAQRAQLNETMALAEQLGGQALTLSGQQVAQEILAYARRRNVTKIVVGKPEQPRWREWMTGSIVDQLIRRSGTIDIYVIRHERDSQIPERRTDRTRLSFASGYVWAGGICLFATALGMLIYHAIGNRGDGYRINALMIHLVAVLVIASRFGRGPAIAASLFSVAAFDFTVVPPYYTFAVSDYQYVFTFAVMLATALIISTLADRIRQQALAARDRERRTAALLSLSRDLASTLEKAQIAKAVARHVSEVFDSTAVVIMQNGKGDLTLAATSKDIEPLNDKELSVVRWVFDHGKPAGVGTDTLPASSGLFLPMTATRGVVGVLGLLESPRTRDPERQRLLEAFANQSALALERAVLAEESRRAWERVEAEFLRNTLLSGVSHDLRTPLATITGAASSIAESQGISDESRKELARDIVSESERMERLIRNLLEMTRLESGGLVLRKDWHPTAEVVGTSLVSARKQLLRHAVTTRLPPDLPMIHVDAITLEEAIVNLLDNAARYTPEGTAIEISASATGDQFLLEIADRGPGIGSDPQRLFQKFYRGPGTADDGSRHGVGLGLAICKGIIELHGGTITAENRSDGGALFRIRLPIGGVPPTVPAESNAEPAP